MSISLYGGGIIESDSETRLDPEEDYRLTYTGLGDMLKAELFELGEVNRLVASVSTIVGEPYSGEVSIITIENKPDSDPNHNVTAFELTLDNFQARGLLP